MKHILSFNFGWGFRLKSNFYCRNHPPSEHYFVCSTISTIPQSADGTTFFLDYWTFIFSHLLHMQLEWLKVSVVVWFVAATLKSCFSYLRCSLRHIKTSCISEGIVHYAWFLKYIFLKSKLLSSKNRNNWVI
jgi:hypothetical protein